METGPIQGVGPTLDALLRQPARVIQELRVGERGRLIRALLMVALAGVIVYGLVVGSFSGGRQLWAAPLKLAGGMLFSALICLPSLFIFSCLSGSRARLAQVAGLQCGLLALMTLLLMGFAPVAWVFSRSTESIVAMGALHLVFWVIALYFGLRFLSRGFAHMDDRTGGGFKVWMVVFVLVMLQMTTALRPIIGTADTLLPEEKKFFLGHWFEVVENSTR
jgi:hypothetical protein